MRKRRSQPPPERRRRASEPFSPGHPLRHGLGLVARRVPGHQDEEQEVDKREQSRQPRSLVLGVEGIRPAAAELSPDRDRHGTEITENEEADDEYRQPR